MIKRRRQRSLRIYLWMMLSAWIRVKPVIERRNLMGI
jgi:hypothetical protein